MTKPNSSNSKITVAKTGAASDESPTVPDVIPAEWNVLPRSASRDEADVHWFFNWAEADMTPSPLLNPWEQSMLGRSIKAKDTSQVVPIEFRGVREAAVRSSRVRRALCAIAPEHVSVLARWSAPPMRHRAAVRTVFGRLSAVAALTEGFDEIGGAEALIRACERAASPKTKEGAENFLRHQAKVKLDVIRKQAEELLLDAFTAFAEARAKVDAELAADAARRKAARSPALATLMAANTNDGEGARALAALISKSGR